MFISHFHAGSYLVDNAAIYLYIYLPMYLYMCLDVDTRMYVRLCKAFSMEPTHVKMSKFSGRGRKT